MKKRLAIILAVLMVLVLVGCSQDNKGVNNSTSESKEQKEKMQSLRVYSGAGLRKAMDEIGREFQEEFNVQVNYNYAGSAQNLSQIELSQQGDVYIPGAAHYIKTAMEKGFVKYSKDVVYHIPVIGVPKGNPANISKLEDLAKPGVKLVLGDERAAAIGRVAQKMLKKNGLLEAAEENVVTKDATVNEVVMHTAMEQGDASIVWKDNIFNTEKVEAIEIPKDKNLIKRVPIGALTFSKNPELAKKFVDFVASDKGKTIFEKYGFKAIK